MWSVNTLVLAHVAAVAALAGPLTYAAVSKLMAPSAFVGALPQFRLDLPNDPAVASAVGALELASAASLLLVVRWESAAFCAVLYVIFAIVVGRALRLGASGECGCFGSLPSRIDGLAVLRNIGLGLAALMVALGRALDVLPNYGLSIALIVGVTMLLGTAALDTFVAVRRTPS